jgi:hypothetical protein
VTGMFNASRSILGPRTEFSILLGANRRDVEAVRSAASEGAKRRSFEINVDTVSGSSS